MRKDKRPISPKQSLLDLAVQHYGSVEGIAHLVLSGQFASFTSATDSRRTFSRGEVLDSEVVSELERMGVSPTTYVVGGQSVPPDGGGDFSNDFSCDFYTGEVCVSGGDMNNDFSDDFSNE